MSTWLIMVLVFAAVLSLGVLLANIVYDRLEAAKETFAAADDPSLADLASQINPDRILVPTLVGVLGLPFLLWLFTGNPALSLIVGIGISALPRLWLQMVQRKRRQQFELQLPDALQSVSSSLQAGLSLQQAVDVLAREAPDPLCYEFGLVARQLRLGGDFDSATEGLLRRMPLESLRVSIAAMRISRSIGGNLVELVQELAETMRRKEEMEGKIRSMTAQGKVQGLVMGLLPLPLMGILTLMEPEAMRHMFTTPVGWAALGFVTVMLTLGFVSIQKIIRIDV